MPDREDFLRSIPLCEGLPAEAIQSIAAGSVRAGFDAGAFIFDEGDDAGMFHIIRTGRVKIIRQGASGRSVLFDVASSGDVLDLAAVASEEVHTVSTQAWTPIETLLIPRGLFSQVARRHPLLWRNASRELARGIQSALRCGTYVTLSVEERFSRLLLLLGDRVGTIEGEGVRLSVPLTQREIAEMIGTTTETACRTWARWKRQGRIRKVGTELLIVPLT
ncbi:MAG: Crp/Fnr family transcriptional regulator, partial [Myxococcales bacterium]|nr:Crp/Fnr family transcriptional regulator [Myxococcales bacterium]